MKFRRTFLEKCVALIAGVGLRGVARAAHGDPMRQRLGSSFSVVMLIGRGKSRQESFGSATQQIADILDGESFPVGYLAMDKAGNTGLRVIHPVLNHSKYFLK